MEKARLEEEWLEKLIEKKLTSKKQVEELEKLWEFLSENRLEELFERLVDKGVTTLESLYMINKENVDKLHLGLEPLEALRLLKVLEKVNIFPSFSAFSQLFLTQ